MKITSCLCLTGRYGLFMNAIFRRGDWSGWFLLYSAAVCGLWMWIFPVSGDGDAVMHFENFREGQSSVKSILHPWARPLYAAVNIPASYLGMTASRLFHLGMALLMAWQTYLYARELRLKYAYFAIPFALLQPYALLLSGDTMTEIPYALLAIVALRCWHHGKYVCVSVLVGLSPLVRPEGFFLGLLFGLLLLTYRPTGIRLVRRWLILSLASSGILIWLLAGRLWANDWLYVVHSWPWGDDLDYGAGSIFDYPLALPFIIGLPFFIPWLMGTFSRPFEKKLIPNQVMWWMVFLVHTLLWATGMMGSAGLLRIIACVTPFSAIICVKGWGVLIKNLERQESRILNNVKLSSALFLLLAGGYGLAYNYILPHNHYGKVTYELYEKLADHTDEAPSIVSSDPALYGLLDLDAFDKRLQSNFSYREGQLDLLARQPKGTVCLWDDQRGASWHHVRCSDLEALGYEILHEYTGEVFPSYYWQAAPLRGVVAVKRTEAKLN